MRKDTNYTVLNFNICMLHQRLISLFSIPPYFPVLTTAYTKYTEFQYTIQITCKYNYSANMSANMAAPANLESLQYSSRPLPCYTGQHFHACMAQWLNNPSTLILSHPLNATQYQRTL